MKFANFSLMSLIVSLISITLVVLYYYKFDRKLKYFLKRLIVPKVYFTTKYRLLFFILGFIFLLFAYYRPQWGKEKLAVSTPNTALHIVIDVSKSMLVQDIKPSRLDFAKMTLKKLLKNLGTTNISLIAFSNKAVTVLPPTVDYELLSYYIDLISPSLFSGGGSAIGEGLQEVIKLSNKFEKNAVLLVSDGETSSDLSNILKKLKAKNIKVHTLLIGTKNGGPVPEIDYSGKVIGYKEQDGKTIISHATDNTLRNIANTTGGKFARPTYLSINNVLRDLYSATKYSKSSVIKLKEQYPYFLIVAFFMFLGALL